jgi:hypothetical protein
VPPWLEADTTCRATSHDAQTHANSSPNSRIIGYDERSRPLGHLMRVAADASERVARAVESGRQTPQGPGGGRPTNGEIESDRVRGGRP